MEELPIYIPHSKVCHMAQYQCCKRHQDCPLYSRCSQIKFQNTVCCQDCPSCTYEGCSLTAQQRQKQPVYVDHVIQQDRLDLNLEIRYMQEHLNHRKQHKKMWEFYNKLFGDLRERRNQRQRERYWQDPEYHRMLVRKSYYKHRAPSVRRINPPVLPECGMECFNCPHEDCILPENWLQQSYMADYLRKNPDYFAKYREAHREELREKYRLYYAENKVDVLRRQQERRQKPEVKAQRAAYNKSYRKAHPESAKRKKRKYIDAHRDRVNANKRSYQQKHRDEINLRQKQHYWEHRDEISARRRQRRLEKKKAEMQRKEKTV